jgi:uncharacterized membrane protein (DUF2068 family)
MNGSGERPPLALRTIAVFETAKGALVLGAACGLLSLRNTDLHAVTDAFLLRHGINPETHYMRLFIETVAKATNHHVGEIAALGFVYALVRFAEGYGLWWGKHWAEWFAALSAGIYLPFEAWHFAARPGFFTGALILINVTIVCYLSWLLAQQRAKRKKAPRAEFVSRIAK